MRAEGKVCLAIPAAEGGKKIEIPLNLLSISLWRILNNLVIDIPLKAIYIESYWKINELDKKLKIFNMKINNHQQWVIFMMFI